MEPGEAAEGPARDPDVEGVCAHQDQLSTCAADGAPHMADGGHGAETEHPTRRADAGEHYSPQQYPHDQVIQVEEEDEQHKVVPVDGCPRSRTQAAEVWWVCCKSWSYYHHVGADDHEGQEGFEMADDGDGYGCAFLFYFISV
jgi:hypothetical protein